MPEKKQRKRKPIDTASYVCLNGVPVGSKSLTCEQRRKLAEWIKLTYLNEAFRGRAIFRYGKE